MVMQWGMSDKLGRVRYQSNQEEVFLGHSVAQSTNISEETAKMIDDEVRSLIEQGEATARRILEEKNDQWVALSKALIEYETLSGEEIIALVNEGKQPVRDVDEPPAPRPSTVVPNAGRPRPGPEAAGGMEPQPQA